MKMAKKVSEEPKAQDEQKVEKAEKKTTAKKELTPEEGVIILACVNEKFLEKVNKLAEKDGLKVVLTNDQVIHDYVAQQAGEIDEAARMTAFLKDERNRKIAFAHANEMFRILTHGKFNKDHADRFTFSKKELVHATTLSWTKAEEMLNTLEAFGFVVKIDKTSFKFHFDYKDIRQQIYSEVILSVESVNHDIQRFKGALENSTDLQEDEKAKAMSEIQAEVTKNIVF